ncbi:MAG: hypothetical protein GXO37_04385 [Chloroflexi bacterium]|nr:hypothetical protein [Chloroflexota bacterium]
MSESLRLHPEDLVLVAIVPQPRDLHIARTLGWYRIPLASAPKIVAVDWLALYQPASFGPQHRWRIEYAAPVLGHELVRRVELFRDEPDHPRAQEEYFKLQLGPLVRLPQPIRAGKWRRVTFFYTTGARLQQAATLADLRADAAERRVLWRALRERAARQEEYRVPSLPEVPPEAWLALLGWHGGEVSG